MAGKTVYEWMDEIHICTSKMKNKPDRISIFLNEENDFLAKKIEVLLLFSIQGCRTQARLEEAFAVLQA